MLPAPAGIAEMLGVPSEHHERFRRWSDAVFGIGKGFTIAAAQAAARL